MIDTTLPLYYRATGKPATITEAVPVKRYHVQFSNGCTAWMTEEELEQKLTNEAPKFGFDMALAASHMRVIGDSTAVHFKVRRKYGDYPGQSVSLPEVRQLYEHLGRWLADRDPSRHYSAPQPAGLTATEQHALATAMATAGWSQP